MVDQHVDVYVHIDGEDIHAGRLYAHRRRGRESSTFSYENSYITRDDAYPLDPALPLATGSYQSRPHQPTFGAFSDCAPDRWGRRLVRKAEKQRVQREGGTARSFGEMDYLLGVRDDLREGALRFRHPNTGQFMASDETGVPPLIELPRLLSAAEKLEHDNADDDDVALLIHGGSSLGGARPKAHIISVNGNLAIAKFPNVSGDDWSVPAWEHVALSLAKKAGIRASRSALMTVAGKKVLIVDRFDRGAEQRIGYVSAMTMLEANDGDERSYLEIADVIEQNSPAVEEDLHELWRRIAFSILISNTDDHLRNHGFLRITKEGWRLSPAFDINPNPQPGNTNLSTAIDIDDTTASIDLLMKVIPYFRLSARQAQAFLADIRAAIAPWRDLSRQLGIPDREIALMEQAFDDT